MLGAVLGDIIGSPYEFNNIKTEDFPLINSQSRFTDDTVLTIAVGKTLVEWGRKGDLNTFKRKLIINLKEYGRAYPDCGFGERFKEWVFSDETEPYYSCGNGSAMRVSAVGYFARDLSEAEKIAKASAEVTHNHPDGIAGAMATAAAVYLARAKTPKKEIKRYIEDKYYKIPFTLEDIRPSYKFNPTCAGTVPHALEAFFEGGSFEKAVRLSVSIGGDSDTLCAISGAVAGAYYSIDRALIKNGLSLLDERLREDYNYIVENIYK